MRGRTALGTILLGVFFAPQLALADEGGYAIQLDAQLTSLEALGAGQSHVDQALMVANLPVVQGVDELNGRTWMDLRGDGLKVTRVWENATIIRNPASGGIFHIHRWFPVLEELEASQMRIRLESRMPDADLRLLVPQGNAAARLETGTMGLSAQLPVDWPVPTRPTSLGLTETHDFDEAPAIGLWGSLDPVALERADAVAMYVDEWDIVLEANGRTYEWQLGRRAVAPPGATVEQEVYSFLLVTFDVGRIEFSESFFEFQFVQALETATIEGAARVHVLEGTLRVDGATTALASETLALEGTFLTTFQTDALGLAEDFSIVAQGYGTTSASHRPLSGDASLEEGHPFLYLLWGLLAMVIVAVVAPLSMKRWGHAPPARRLARPPRAVSRKARPAEEPTGVAPPTPSVPATTTATPKTVATLVHAVREKPFDAKAHFDLGVMLIERGEDVLGVRHLNRSFFIEPKHILVLLKSPQYAPLREHGDVRRMLARFQRDFQRRLWSGYV